ncbi:MAG: hypothetical protein GF364_13030 [Candidatus Lokiarchaeota archaeon]|nr:hypothetical protein [Candidatus Lokiarchaeota archaeon]
MKKQELVIECLEQSNKIYNLNYEVNFKRIKKDEQESIFYYNVSIVENNISNANLSAFYLAKYDIIALSIDLQREYFNVLTALNENRMDDIYFAQLVPQRKLIWKILKEIDQINELRVYTEDGIQNAEEMKSEMEKITDYPLYSALVAFKEENITYQMYFYGSSLSIPEHQQDKFYVFIKKILPIFR